MATCPCWSPSGCRAVPQGHFSPGTGTAAWVLRGWFGTDPGGSPSLSWPQVSRRKWGLEKSQPQLGSFPIYSPLNKRAFLSTEMQIHIRMREAIENPSNLLSVEKLSAWMEIFIKLWFRYVLFTPKSQKFLPKNLEEEPVLLIEWCHSAHGE